MFVLSSPVGVKNVPPFTVATFQFINDTCFVFLNVPFSITISPLSSFLIVFNPPS